MSVPFENQRQKQTDGRKFNPKKMLYILVIVLFLIIVFFLYVTQPIIRMGIPQSQLSVDPKRLETYVRTLSESFVPRDQSHPAILDLCAAYIRREFESVSASVSEQPFTVEGKTYRNVIALFGPETTEMVVIGAHYDTAGPLPGADDNAS